MMADFLFLHFLSMIIIYSEACSPNNPPTPSPPSPAPTQDCPMNAKTCVGFKNILKIKAVDGPDNCSMIIINYFYYTFVHTVQQCPALKLGIRADTIITTNQPVSLHFTRLNYKSNSKVK